MNRAEDAIKALITLSTLLFAGIVGPLGGLINWFEDESASAAIQVGGTAFVGATCIAFALIAFR